MILEVGVVCVVLEVQGEESNDNTVFTTMYLG